MDATTLLALEAIVIAIDLVCVLVIRKWWKGRRR